MLIEDKRDTSRGRCFRTLWATLILWLALTPAVLSGQVPELPAEVASNAAYLEYVLDTIQHADWRGKRYIQQRPLRVLDIGSPTESAKVIVAFNPRFGENIPAGFSCRLILRDVTVDDDPANLIVNDWDLLRTASGEASILGAGYRGFEAMACAFFPDNDSQATQYLPLCSGTDASGDGVWNPETSVLLVEDFDFDGVDEAFVYINSQEDRAPRELFCIEIAPLRIQWSLPLASLPRRQSFFSTGDTANPAVLFATYDPRNGIRDSLFSDDYCSLVVISSDGEVLLNKPIAHHHGGVALCRSIEGNTFYLSHEDTTAASDDSLARYAISEIDSQGLFEKTVSVSGKPSCLWLAEWGDNNATCLFVRTSEGVIHQYDTALSLIASSPRVACGDHLAVISLSGQDEPVHVFSRGIYSNELEELARFGTGETWVEPLEVDGDGLSTVLAVGGENRFIIARPRQRSQLELLSIFLHRHQTTLVSILTGLIVSLVLVNYYRARAKANLTLIAAQKADLEEAHQALKAAQARIVEQEKYKQAQGIAGGFAHEIRNALLPSEGALLRLDSIDLTDPEASAKISKYRSAISKSVDRALDMTELIATYTRLESKPSTGICEVSVELRNLIAANEDRIRDMGVEIIVDVPEGIRAACSPQRFHVVVSNLVLNSLDALKEKEGPRISIGAALSDDNIILLHQDNGCGIPESDRGRVFEMFFSTKPDTGKGIGLAMVRKVLETCNGSISLRDSFEWSTTFEVIIPKAVQKGNA